MTAKVTSSKNIYISVRHVAENIRNCRILNYLPQLVGFRPNKLAMPVGESRRVIVSQEEKTSSLKSTVSTIAVLTFFVRVVGELPGSLTRFFLIVDERPDNVS